MHTEYVEVRALMLVCACAHACVLNIYRTDLDVCTCACVFVCVKKNIKRKKKERKKNNVYVLQGCF